ncbi:hypothetical protein [Phenylobacterium sp.]|jgi:hypothetical protein|uniref:hypothetical protein n=1 Tax=Phenylobacterium sp. TaxID=1871053 RepID=UPI002F415286
MRRLPLLLTGLVLAAALPALAQSPAAKAPAKPAPAAAKPGASAATVTTISAPSGAVLLSVKDVMRHIVNPAAEAYWARSGEIDDASGAHDRTPTAADEANWKVSLDSAAQLVEAGNLLRMDGRARDPNGPWNKYAVALTNAGLSAMTAVNSKDVTKTFDAGSAMYDACFNCHGKYIQRPKDSLYKHNIDKDFEAAGKPSH